MSWSDATASPVFEEVRRTAALGVLASDDFALGSAPDEAPARFPYTPPVIWRPATADVEWSADNSADDPGTRLINRIAAATQFSMAWVGGNVDSSTDDPTTRLINRVMAATQHDEIVDVLPLLDLRAIAARLDYLHEISRDDPDEPTMALASLRELALFFVSEPLYVSEQQNGEPEIGISPDGMLQAEWRVRDGGILAMKFLSDGLIQFAAVSRPTSGQRPFRVNGTLPKDEALRTVQPFTRSGTPR